MLAGKEGGSGFRRLRTMLMRLLRHVRAPDQRLCYKELGEGIPTLLTEVRAEQHELRGLVGEVVGVQG